MFGQAERVYELNKLQQKKDEEHPAKIFAFTSGKGGTGKTFLSLNLAYALSKQTKKVLFIDLDSNLSNSNIMLNLVADKTIHDFYAQKMMLKELITEYNPTLHFIFGDSGKLDYPQLKNGIINRFFRQLKTIQTNYDFIFLDTGSGANEETLNILLNTDVNILVTSPEPTAVMDSYVMIKLLNSENYKGEKLVIINKCYEKEDGKTTFNNLKNAAEHFLKIKLHFLGEINFDRAVNESIISQNLLLENNPQSAVGNQIINISKRFHNFTHMANILHI